MKRIEVLGMGPGTREFISPFVINSIKNADIVIGGKRHFLEVQEEIKGKEQVVIDSQLLKLVEFIKSNRDKKIAILVSGDPGFYSFLVFLKKHFSKEQLYVVPGLSSMQYMFCKVALPWQDAVVKSLHGKKFDYLKALSECGLVGVLTDSYNTPQNIALTLVSKGLGEVKMYIGESLSYKDEKITQKTALEISKERREFKMNVVILQKEENVSY